MLLPVPTLPAVQWQCLLARSLAAYAAEGEAFASALQAHFNTSKNSHFFPCHHFRSGQGAAACQDCVWAVASNCSWGSCCAPLACLGSSASCRNSCPSASQPAVKPHSPTCYSLPFEKSRNQSFKTIKVLLSHCLALALKRS